MRSSSESGSGETAGVYFRRSTPQTHDANSSESATLSPGRPGPDPLSVGHGSIRPYAQVMNGPSREALGAMGALVLLVVRGLLLWILIPLGFALWLLSIGWGARVALGAFLGWLDLNLLAALERTLLRPVGGLQSMPRVEFVPVRRMQSVSHRVHLVLDSY